MPNKVSSPLKTHTNVMLKCKNIECLCLLQENSLGIYYKIVCDFTGDKDKGLRIIPNKISEWSLPVRDEAVLHEKQQPALIQRTLSTHL